VKFHDGQVCSIFKLMWCVIIHYTSHLNPASPYFYAHYPYYKYV
jgi:hypothetical protein